MKPFTESIEVVDHVDAVSLEMRPTTALPNEFLFAEVNERQHSGVIFNYPQAVALRDYLNRWLSHVDNDTRRRRAELISDAAEAKATDKIGDDELERFAREQEKK